MGSSSGTTMIRIIIWVIQANFFFEYLIAFLTGLAVLLENLQWQLKLNSGISIVNQPVPSVYKDPIEEKKGTQEVQQSEKRD